MSECPYCKNQIKLKSNNAFANFKVFLKANTVLTECCNNFVKVSAEVTYKWIYQKARVEGYLLPNGNLEFSDDWGNNKIKEVPPEEEIQHNGHTYVLKRKER